MGRSEGWIVLALSIVVVGGVTAAYVLGVNQGRQTSLPPARSSKEARTPERAAPQRSVKPDVSVHETSRQATSATFDDVWRRFVEGFASKPDVQVRAELTGGGSGQSSYFTVHGNHQMFLWAVDPNASLSTFIVEIKDANKRHVDQFIPDAETRFYGGNQLRLDPGTYYLDVTAFGQWRVAVIE